MPTPVGVARQCLADSAAAVFDDAVSVAKRRSHVQTTSLHIVSALLALPSSTVREACTRARSSPYSPRLQFRALELCVGVALDRVSVSKSVSEDPPVSNSLMAAIRRSQANQRRHPETFHLYQQQLSSNSQNPPSISAVKVELKHFVMSILDDPIVSRAFGDAGFLTEEIKLAILNPLSMSRFSSVATRPPPLFLCNLNDFELNKRGHNFPFSEAVGTEKVDNNSRRIGEILVNTTRRNPLLIGASAGDAYRNFINCLKRGETEVLPKEIDRLSVISIENEVAEFAREGLSEEMMGLKFKQVDEMVENCRGPGIIVSCGDLKAFVDVESRDAVNCIVSQLKGLLIKPGGKLWLVGFLAGDDDYKKLLERIPSIEMDWNLHLLPITTSSIGGSGFKSSLMRSFVPFGGFFPMPSELESPCTSAIQSSRFCNLCNQKYEQEVSAVLKGVTTDSLAHKQSVNLPSWLRIAECETSNRSQIIKAKEDKTVLDARVVALQRKWSDICQRLHSPWTSQENIIRSKPHTFQNVPIWKDPVGVGRITNLSPCMPSDLQKSYLTKQNTLEPVSMSAGGNARSEMQMQSLELNHLRNSSASQQKTSPPIISPSVSPVTTDLRLGALYDSAEECRKPNLQEHYNRIQNSEPPRSHEKSPSQVSQSSAFFHHCEKPIYPKDLEHQWKILAEKVYWQMEAIQTISRTVSRCRNGNGRCHSSNKGNVWLTFLGPDKVGKRKIAASLAEVVFGRKEDLLSFDLSSEDLISPFNLIVDCYDSKHQNMKSGRKLIVDYLAEALSKHPHSVVLLENVGKADLYVQDSLSQAVKTGKFPDSRGRDINVNNNVFVLASSSVLKVSKDLVFCKVASEFPEDEILEAKNFQMQILVGSVDGSNCRSTTNVSVIPSKMNLDQTAVNKRKLITKDSTKAELSKRACQLYRSNIDLNLPVEDTEDNNDIDKSGDDDDSSDKADVWLQELLEHVDENVVFKPFDFDSLSQKILKQIDAQLKKVIGGPFKLEIDRQVMVQILAAAWLTDRNNALEDWTEQVLSSSIEEARQRYNVTSNIVMKLVSRDGLVAEAQASGVCLPARINVQ